MNVKNLVKKSVIGIGNVDVKVKFKMDKAQVSEVVEAAVKEFGFRNLSKEQWEDVVEMIDNKMNFDIAEYIDLKADKGLSGAAITKDIFAIVADVLGVKFEEKESEATITDEAETEVVELSNEELTPNTVIKNYVLLKAVESEVEENEVVIDQVINNVIEALCSADLLNHNKLDLPLTRHGHEELSKNLSVYGKDVEKDLKRKTEINKMNNKTSERLLVKEQAVKLVDLNKGKNVKQVVKEYTFNVVYKSIEGTFIKHKSFSKMIAKQLTKNILNELWKNNEIKGSHLIMKDLSHFHSVNVFVALINWERAYNDNLR